MVKRQLGPGFGAALCRNVRQLPDGVRKYVVNITCEACSAVGEASDRRNAHPDHHHNHFKDMGWEVWNHGNRAICPECSRNRSSQKSTVKEDLMVMDSNFMPAAALAVEALPAAEVLVLDVQEAAPLSPAATVLPKGKTTRLSMKDRMELAEMYLKEHYLPELMAYKSGHSDARGAEESGLTLELFVQVREEDFGPLYDFSGLKEELDTFGNTLHTRLQVITVRIEALTKGLEAADTASLPPQVGSFLAQKRCEVKNIFTLWEERFQRIEARFASESDEALLKLEQSAQDTFAALHNAEVAKFADALKQLQSYRTELQSLQQQLQEIRDKLPHALR